MRTRKFCAIFLLFTLPFCSALASMGDVGQVFKSANQRFQLMRDIAAYKYVNRLPINITIPERVVLRKVLWYANQKGVNLRTARSFILLGVAIGKKMQQNWIQLWRQQGFPKNEKPKNMRTALIPQLLKLDEQLVDALILAVPALQDPNNLDAIKAEAKQELTAKLLNDTVRAIYVKALLKVRLKPKKKKA